MRVESQLSRCINFVTVIYILTLLSHPSAAGVNMKGVKDYNKSLNNIRPLSVAIHHAQAFMVLLAP